MLKNALTTLTAAAAALALAGAARAEHPTPYQMKRVKVIAHQLDEAAHRLHKAAEDYAHHGGYYERRALAALHELDRKASHFHRQVERYYQNPYHTERDFEKLYYAYRSASWRFRYLHAEDHVYEYFHEVQELMDELLRYYGGYRAYDRRQRGHDHDYDYRYRYRYRYRWPYLK